MAEIARYLKKVRSLYEARTYEASAYRQPLKALMASTAEGVTTAPVRTLAGFSSADLVVLVNGEPIGHILYEDIDTDLDEVEQGWQGEVGPPEGDLLVTNFVEFRHYRDGTLVRSARLAHAGRVFKLDRRGEARTDRLLQNFVGKRARQGAPSARESSSQALNEPPSSGAQDGQGSQEQAVEEFQFFDNLFDKEQVDEPPGEVDEEPAPAEDDESGRRKRGFFGRLFSAHDKSESKEAASAPGESEQSAAEGQSRELEGTLLDLTLTMPAIREFEDVELPDVPPEVALPDMPPEASPAPREAAVPPEAGETPSIARQPSGDRESPVWARPLEPGSEPPWWLEGEDQTPEPTPAPAAKQPARRKRRRSEPLPISPGTPGVELPRAALQARLVDAQERGERREIANLLCRLGYNLYKHEEINEAVDHYWQALVHFRELGERHEEAAVLACLGTIYAAAGEREYALNQFIDALPLLEEVDDPFLAGFIQGHMGIVHYEMGIYEAAANNLADALPLVTSDEMLYGLLIGKRGEAEYRLGNVERAATLLEEALLYRFEQEAQHAQILSTLGSARYWLKQYRAAAGALKDALHVVQGTDDHPQEGKLWSRLGAALHMAGDFEKADDAQRKALAIHRALGNTQGEATALYNLAGTYEARQDFEEATDLFERAEIFFNTAGDAEHAVSARQSIERVRARSAEIESAG
jgi:tetratricopeptide (TPR) repeat protein